MALASAMPRSSQQTREKILQAAFAMFRKTGFFRAGMDEIAAAGGVTKRTLYHHFESKDALLAAVLTAQHEQAFAILPQPYGVPLTGTAAEIADALFRQLVKWSSKPKWPGSGFTRLAIELADLPGHPARTVGRRHKSAMERYWIDVLTSAGVSEPRQCAREMMILIEGAMVMILIHGDRSYAEVAAKAAKRLLVDMG